MKNFHSYLIGFEISYKLVELCAKDNIYARSMKECGFYLRVFFGCRFTVEVLPDYMLIGINY